MLAIAEHLDTLKMDVPPQDVEIVSKDGEVVSTPNPLWIKVKTLKNRAASDVLNIMRNVDPQAMKGRKTDRLQSLIHGITAWKQPGGQTQ